MSILDWGGDISTAIEKHSDQRAEGCVLLVQNELFLATLLALQSPSLGSPARL